MNLDLHENETVAAEPVEAGAGAQAGASSDPPEPAAVAAEPAPAPEAAPAWAPDPNEWAQVMNFVRNQEAQTAAQIPAEPQGPNPADYFQTDPETGNLLIDMDGLARYNRDLARAEAEAIYREQFGDVRPILDETIRERGDAILEEKYAAMETELGKFDHKVASLVGNGLLSETAGDPFMAARRGAEVVADLIKRERAAAVEEYKQTLGNIGNAPQEPGVAAAATELFQPRKGLAGYDDVANNFVARHTGGVVTP